MFGHGSAPTPRDAIERSLVDGDHSRSVWTQVDAEMLTVSHGNIMFVGCSVDSGSEDVAEGPQLVKGDGLGVRKECRRWRIGLRRLLLSPTRDLHDKYGRMVKEDEEAMIQDCQTGSSGNPWPGESNGPSSPHSGYISIMMDMFSVGSVDTFRCVVLGPARLLHGQTQLSQDRKGDEEGSETPVASACSLRRTLGGLSDERGQPLSPDSQRSGQRVALKRCAGP